MKIVLQDKKPLSCRCDALIIPLAESELSLPDWVSGPDRTFVAKLFASREFEGKTNQISLIHLPGAAGQRLLLVGLGKRSELTGERLRQAGGRASLFLSAARCASAAASIDSFRVVGQTPEPFVEGAALAVYSFDCFREASQDDQRNKLRTFVLLGRREASLAQELRWTEETASAVHFARDLVNTPSNELTPTALARTARSLRGGKLSVDIVGPKEAARLGMGSYLSVGRGSQEPPQFIVLTYRGRKTRPIVLVGKSVTFDSGGISIKPSEGMERMKYDMAGGAAVLAVMRTINRMQAPLHVVGILPAAENLPSGSASRPGDIVRAMNGKTIEIISTDAEGRMTLADAITYALGKEPRAVIDIATLTGACPIALGSEAMALMSDSEGLVSALRKAGEKTFERVWRMPLYDEYLEYLKSDFADLKNASGRTGSLVTAARFLREFSGETPWAHLDIADTAWTEKERAYTSRGATGVGVRLLTQFLREFDDASV